MKTIFIIIIFFTMNFCLINSDESCLKIYIFKQDIKLNSNLVNSKNILEKEFFIESTDIISYNKDSKELTLKNVAWDRIKNTILINTVGVNGLPFLMIFKNGLFFEGRIWNILSSNNHSEDIIIYYHNLMKNKFILSYPNSLFNNSKSSKQLDSLLVNCLRK